MKKVFASLAVVFWLVLCTQAQSPAQAFISLDVRQLDIFDVIRLLSTQASANLVLDASVPHHPITLRLQHVPFEKALETIATTNALEILHVGNVTYLGPPDTINRSYPDADGVSGSRTLVVPLKNANPDDVAKMLSDRLPKGTLISADRRISAVVVTGSLAELSRARTLATSMDASNARQTSTLSMRFAKASDVLGALRASTTIDSTQSAYADDTQNAIVLAGTSGFIDSASALIARFDRPGQQVRYDVKVTDITPQSDSSNIGAIFGGFDVNGNLTPGAAVYTFLRNSLAINATINALVTEGRASILAQPSLSTLNNVPASLLVGQSYPIVYFDPRTGTQQVQFVNVGVNLNVTPTIGFDGAITTNLETDYSQFLSFVNNFPVIGTRKAQSTLRVRDGETIVIAGLFSDVSQSTVTKVPFLADIPILGEIFKNRQKSRTKDEVVFLITPHIVATAREAPQAGSAAGATAPQ